MRKVLMLTGLQGSGKTTTAARVTQELWSLGYKAVRLKFADVLYQMHDAVRDVLRRYTMDEVKGPDGTLLQLLGTEWGRKTRGDDIWVRVLRASITDYWLMNEDGIVVIDDCRFENEYKMFFGEAGVQVTHVRLKAPRETRKLRAEKWRDNETHISETGLDGLGDDWFSIVADTSLESVGSVARRIVDELIKQEPRPSVTA
jgi:hypothetical protein